MANDMAKLAEEAEVSGAVQLQEVGSLRAWSEWKDNREFATLVLSWTHHKHAFFIFPRRDEIMQALIHPEENSRLRMELEQSQLQLKKAEEEIAQLRVFHGQSPEIDLLWEGARPPEPQLFVPFCANVYAEGSVSDAQDTWHHWISMATCGLSASHGCATSSWQSHNWNDTKAAKNNLWQPWNVDIRLYYNIFFIFLYIYSICDLHIYIYISYCDIYFIILLILCWFLLSFALQVFPGVRCQNHEEAELMSMTFWSLGRMVTWWSPICRLQVREAFITESFATRRLKECLQQPTYDERRDMADG